MSDLTPAVRCFSNTPRNEKSHLAVAFFCYLAERVGFAYMLQAAPSRVRDGLLIPHAGRAGALLL